MDLVVFRGTRAAFRVVDVAVRLGDGADRATAPHRSRPLSWLRGAGTTVVRLWNVASLVSIGDVGNDY